MRQLAQLAEELDRAGVALRSATEPFDTGAAAGRMMLQMLAVFAEFEHATIVDRITAGIERRAKEGRWASGRVAFGYRRNAEKLVVPDEREAPVVKRIFRLYTEDRLGTTSIARLLTDEHAPAPARGWQPAVVQWLLQNEAYLGRVNWRGQSFPGLHEPLIDEPTFQAAQALLRERGEDLTRRRGNRSEFLLSGRDPLRPLRPRLRRHEREGQRRPLPLLRLLGPAEARPQSLRRRTLEPRQARSTPSSTSSPASTATAT